MLGIDEEHVREHERGPDLRPEYDDSDACILAYNLTDPTVHSDGIDRVAVVEEADDRYLVDYWGYQRGAMWVTSDGIAELGSHLLGERGPVPRWLVAKRLGTGALPWRVPDGYDGEPDVDSTHCRESITAGNILKPGSMDGDRDVALSKECWDEGHYGF